MNRLNRRNLSSGRVALIISVVALVLALAGTAFSGGSAVPGKNGVKASDIAKGAVKEGKLAGAAVTAPKIAGGAVTEAKIGAKAVTSEKVFLNGGVDPEPPPHRRGNLHQLSRSRGWHQCQRSRPGHPAAWLCGYVHADGETGAAQPTQSSSRSATRSPQALVTPME